MEEKRRRMNKRWKSMVIRIGNERGEGGLSHFFLLLELFLRMNNVGAVGETKACKNGLSELNRMGMKKVEKEWMGGILGFVLIIGGDGKRSQNFVHPSTFIFVTFFTFFGIVELRVGVKEIPCLRNQIIRDVKEISFDVARH